VESRTVPGMAQVKTRYTRGRVHAATLAVALALSLVTVACSVDSAKNHYTLAEKLWTDQKYAAAVTEFEKVLNKDPHGKLGIQALYRAAMTEALFLSAYNGALRKFRQYVELGQDPSMIWEARLQIGELLFAKTEQYDQAILHYQTLLKDSHNPEVKAQTPEFLFRIGKAHFFLWHFDEAIAVFHDIQKRFPKSPWAEKALYEAAQATFTRVEQRAQSDSRRPDAHTEAIAAFNAFIKHYPKSEWVPLAKFGIASCLEEQDQLDAAYEVYEEIKATYPSPNVIEVKLAKIGERRSQRTH
jgi:TolA-binding protein